jgi:valyl-tRNA synthetase
VRDAEGQKMSKSKGNVLDPLEFIDTYGGDALRFTLAAMAAQGRDVKLSEQRIEGYRNFITKLWNAARFCEMNGCAPAAGFDPTRVKTTVNRWIVGEVAATGEAIDKALAANRFNDAANGIYQFVWGTFCDWYLEFTKPILSGADGKRKDEVRATTAWTLDQILLLLHPFAPFVTEELWGHFCEKRPTQLIEAPWPAYTADHRHEDSSREMGRVVRLISEIRSLRAELHVPPGARVTLLHQGDEPNWLGGNAPQIESLARLDRIGRVDGETPAGSAQIVLDEASFVVPLAGVIDVERESQRLATQLERLGGDIARIDAKLGRKEFLDKAPEHVVEEQRARRIEAEVARERLAHALDRLSPNP